MTTPEAKARENIDAQLNNCGMLIQNREEMNLFATQGVAVREFPLATGFADYLLFVDRKAVGLIEAKKEGVPLTREDLDEFVACYNPANRQEREETWSEDNPDGRWRVYDYEALMARDKVSLDIFWIQDESLMDMDNLPDPDVIARDIVEELRAALEQFEGILEDLEG